MLNMTNFIDLCLASLSDQTYIGYDTLLSAYSPVKHSFSDLTVKHDFAVCKNEYISFIIKTILIIQCLNKLFSVDAYKDCTADGTWWKDPNSNREWTNYTMCVSLEVYYHCVISP